MSTIILPGGKKIPSRKKCVRCKRLRPLKNFQRAWTGYYASYCKGCRTVYQLKWAKKHPKQFAETQRRHFAKLKRLGVKRIRDLKKNQVAPRSIKPKTMKPGAQDGIGTT